MQQLIVYQLNAANETAFHALILEHAKPTMRRLGFDILGYWTAERRVGPADKAEGEADGDLREIVYLLSWPDAQTMEAGWAALNADAAYSAARKVLQDERGSVVTKIVNRMLTPLDPADAA